MLTVIREASEALNEEASNNKNLTIEQVFELLVNKAQESLNNTPNLLPVLREAGVVDSGGMGLLTVYKGMYKGLLGETVDVEDDEEENENKKE